MIAFTCGGCGLDVPRDCRGCLPTAAEVIKLIMTRSGLIVVTAPSATTSSSKGTTPS